MNSIFSIDDFSDPFWESPPSLNPDSSTAEEVIVSHHHHHHQSPHQQPEWTFEMFLEEISSSVSSEPLARNNNNAIVGVPSAQSIPSVSGQNDYEDEKNSRLFRYRDSTVIVDSDRVLKNKLENECAAVVALRAKSVKPEELTISPETRIQPAQSSPLPQGSLTQGEFGVTSSSIPTELEKTSVPMKQVTSGSSREDSDDDDLYEENETTGSLNPEDVKKSRRMLSNRESARRSRRRKQEQTSDLETQVNDLKGEHSSLLKQLSNMNHKYDEAAVGNRILKADIETLRAKVKMAEETVKRVTGMNPLLLGRSNGHNNNNRMIPSFQPQQNQMVNPNIGIQSVLSQRLENSFVPTTHNHHVVPRTLNPYSWNHETSPHNTVPQNDSAWPKKCLD